MGGPGSAELSGIGDGYSNTEIIVSNCVTAGIAAKVCWDAATGGYTDWFLPSLDEMSALYASKGILGGFASTTYWTSTEYINPGDPGNLSWPQNYAITLSILSGFPGIAQKANTYGIRPIRNFLQVGDYYQGGYIAYIFKPGDAGYVPGQTHGLIASEFDNAASNTWYNGSYIATGATATGIGVGNTNTTTIVTAQGGVTTYAARTCDIYSYGGYTDWFLPTKDELNQMYVNRAYIPGLAGSYWSSSEIDTNNAWIQNLGTGAQSSAGKNMSYKVRAVRKF
jgi:hypothetical protein